MASPIITLMADDTYDGEPAPPIPNTVLLPALTFGLVTAVTGFTAVVNFGAGDSDLNLAAAVFLATVAAASAVTALGLFRGWRVAHFLAFGLAALIGLTTLRSPASAVFGVGFAGGIIWALSTRSAKDWFGFR